MNVGFSTGTVGYVSSYANGGAKFNNKNVKFNKTDCQAVTSRGCQCKNKPGYNGNNNSKYCHVHSYKDTPCIIRVLGTLFCCCCIAFK